MRLPQFRTFFAVSFGLLIVMVGLSVVAPASAQSGPRSAVRPTAVTGNWAGYVAKSTGAEPAIADFANGDRIDGAWRVPKVDCGSRTDSAVSIWVGLGGYPVSEDTLYQTGTTATCHKGTATYGAWWEVVPGAGYDINDAPVHPGDHMWASIEINHFANEVEIMLANDGQGDDRGWSTAIGRSVPLKDGKYPLSGECVVERPSNTDRLANFGQVSFVNHGEGPTVASTTMTAKTTFDSTRLVLCQSRRTQ